MKGPMARGPTWGHSNSEQIGKVVQVYREKYVIYIEWLQQYRTNGTAVHVGIDSSKVVITKLDWTKTGQRLRKDPWI